MEKDQIEFDIELAEISMKFGAFIAIGLVLFSGGIGLLFSTFDKFIQHIIDSVSHPNPPPIQIDITPLLLGMWIAGGSLLLIGLVIIFGGISWKETKIKNLKKKYLKETKDEPKKETSHKNYFGYRLLGKRYADL